MSDIFPCGGYISDMSVIECDQLYCQTCKNKINEIRTYKTGYAEGYKKGMDDTWEQVRLNGLI